jgi:hypothetical protein
MGPKNAFASSCEAAHLDRLSSMNSTPNPPILSVLESQAILAATKTGFVLQEFPIPTQTFLHCYQLTVVFSA